MNLKNEIKEAHAGDLIRIAAYEYEKKTREKPDTDRFVVVMNADDLLRLKKVDRLVQPKNPTYHGYRVIPSKHIGHGEILFSQKYSLEDDHE